MMISTIVDARIVSDKAFVRETGSNKVTKIRVADNPSRKNDRNPARFVNAEAWGTLGDQLAKLSKGDVVSLTGELKVEKYTDKTGTERKDDVLVVSHFRVQKSESFFGVAAPVDEQQATGNDEIPF